MASRDTHVAHPFLTRRAALQAGSIGLLRLGLTELSALRAVSAPEQARAKKSVIFVFLTGGLSHQDSFDLKPDAPDSVRGEFRRIATQTPGVRICEHLPRLAQMMDKLVPIRSVVGAQDDHDATQCFTGRHPRIGVPAGGVVKSG